MEIVRFDWDEDNIEHIARHNVHPDEVEEVFDSKHIILRTRSNRYLALGKSYAGRHLSIVFEDIEDGIRIVTARDMDGKERKFYRRKN